MYQTGKSPLVQFQELIGNDEVNKIINSAIPRYIWSLSLEDINQIRHLVLWQALQKYNPRQSKFTTYLYNCTLWYSQKYYNDINKGIIINYQNELIEYIHFFEYLDGLDKLNTSIMVDKYQSNMTESEIEKKYKISKKQVKNYINSSLRYIRHQMGV